MAPGAGANEPVASGPVGRLTGIRLASRAPNMPLVGPLSPRLAQATPSEPADGWLVSPDAWFVPEDKPEADSEAPAIEPDGGAEVDSRPSVTEAPGADLGTTPNHAAVGSPAEVEAPAQEAAPAVDSATPPAGPPAVLDPAEQAGEAGLQPSPQSEPQGESTPWPVDRAPSTHPSTPPGAQPGATPRQAAPEPTPEPRETPRTVPADESNDFGGGPHFAPPGVATPAPRPATEPVRPEEEPAQTPTPRLATPERTESDHPQPEADQNDWDRPEWVGPFDEVAPSPAETPSHEAPRDPVTPRFEAPNEAPAGRDADAAMETLGPSLVPNPPTASPPTPNASPRGVVPVAPHASEDETPEPAPTPSPKSSLFTPPSTGTQQPTRVAPAPVRELRPAAPAAAPSLPPAPTRSAPLVAPVAPPQPGRALYGAPSAPPVGVGAGPTHPGGGAQAAAAARQAAGGKSADESHRDLFAKNCYPSAQQCAECHQKIYDEWSVSSHAYAYVSPMFHKFEQRITELSQGTVGHFCTRCHSPVATAMYEARSTPLGQMADSAREGVTCIVCHRVNQRWGKSNGERRIVPGDIHAPVYGGVGGDGVAEVAAKAKEYKVKTSPNPGGKGGKNTPGMDMHAEGRFFDQLTRAEACTSCHQVAVHPGIKLEVVWEQYRASPACKKGVTCQDCHMGRIPGVASGYNYGPIAEINGKTVNNQRKQSSHIFYGPGYSIAHPGVFPQHKDASKWSVEEWLQYDWRAGWGTDEYEERLEKLEDEGVDTAQWFPPKWADPDDRYDAREVIDDNLDRLKKKRRYRELVMENGSKVDGPFFGETPTAGRDLRFEYVVTNLNEGHNLPTASLGAQPQLWANVVLIGPDGRRLWESGYTDSNGDLCDIHSVDVRQGRAPFDKQLFNLQTMFLITGAVGTDREFPLPVNIDFDQVPQLRPGAQPISVINHPPFIRMESRSLAALGKKRVKYTVPAELLCQPGRYRLSFRMRNRTEPMYFMRFCDATPEMLRAMNEGTLDIHPQSVEFEVR